MELKEPELFDLIEFVDKIKVNDSVLSHESETVEQFEKYLKLLGEYTDYDSSSILYYWLDDVQRELESSAEIESHKFAFSNEELLNGDLFFDSLSISNKRIKDIHKFVCEHSKTNKGILVGEYRKTPCWVGNITKDGKEEVIWRAPKAEDIEEFMKSYLEFYKKTSLKKVYSSPFLNSSLASMLFIRIHPFGDGNGRTARVLRNLSFTSSINKYFGTNLKLSPINISNNICINQYTYVRRLDDIVFELNYDNNDAINRWFEFILNMYDEQLYFQMNRIPNYENEKFLYEEFIKRKKDEKKLNEEVERQAQKSKINKLF